MTRNLVSVEKVLNSRCSSDSGPTKSHFGTFTDKNPPEAALDHVLNCLKIPRFSSGNLLHWFQNGYLFLGFETPKDAFAQRLLHVESGMQQEAVYLACAAEGVGTCIENQGINGTQNGEKMSTAKFLIKEITNPYDSGKLATKAPGPQKPFILGKNLAEPLRDGDSDCLVELSRLTTFKKSGSSATEKDTSQLLWAARGRTPHCVKINKWNHMWGLTIPTWGGVQNYASVHLVRDKKLYRYINWTKEFSLMNRLFREILRWTRGNPTHDLRFIRNLDIESHTDGHEEAIVLCQNEQTGRAVWEVGYMLENMLLQAKNLGISFESKVFSPDIVSQLNQLGVPNAVTAFLI